MNRDYQRGNPNTYTCRPFRKRQKLLLFSFVSLLVLFVSACGSDATTTTPQQTTTPQRVNGFGAASNHGHSLIALPNNVLLMATHYGIFRTSNGGENWSEVAAGPGQPMETLMTYALVSSPIDPQRLYVLTQPITNTHKGTLGLYTSANQGQSWQLAFSTEGQNNIFTEAAGNDAANEVYIYQSEDGAQGLKISTDAGKTFKSTGKLPFPTIHGILPLPGVPGTLLIYGDNGVARSTDRGATWKTVAGNFNGSLFYAATAGANTPIYITGDSGVFVSKDEGKTFTQVNSAFYPGLSVSPQQPQIVYGKNARGIYRSDDGGHTWKALPLIKGNLQDLAPDPAHANLLYLSLSYPSQVERYDQGTQQWSSLTPKA
ncbi:MAG TPA: hypothetical protein VL485_20640 [Ktedonobacteraceae bacterium]|nr:hypothetical protein [Ktedonobacteraceae bacterium]